LVELIARTMRSDASNGFFLFAKLTLSSSWFRSPVLIVLLSFSLALLHSLLSLLLLSLPLLSLLSSLSLSLLSLSLLSAVSGEDEQLSAEQLEERRLMRSIGSSFPLHSAAREGKLSQVESLLSSSDAATKLILQKDDDDRTPFHVAAASNHADICQLLVDRLDAANIAPLLQSADESGATPLLSAVASNAAACVRLILRLCGDDADLQASLVNVVNELKNSPLHYAASKGRDELIVVLLEHGAKKNAFNKLGQTPLMRAVSAGQLRSALLLLDRGASAERTDAQGNNVLHVAALQFDRPMLLALLRRRHELALSLDDKNGDGKSLADLVGGADRLAALIAESESSATATATPAAAAAASTTTTTTTQPT